MALVVKPVFEMPTCSQEQQRLPKYPNYGWGVYVEPIPQSSNNIMLMGTTFARECDAKIGLAALSKLAVDWNSTNARLICRQLYAIVNNDKGLDKVMTEHLQW